MSNFTPYTPAPFFLDHNTGADLGRCGGYEASNVEIVRHAMRLARTTTGRVEIFGRGAENAWALYEDLKERGIIRAGGGWSGFSDPSILGDRDRKFRGWTDLSNMLAEDSTLWTRLCALYMEGRL